MPIPEDDAKGVLGNTKAGGRFVLPAFVLLDCKRSRLAESLFPVDGVCPLVDKHDLLGHNNEPCSPSQVPLSHIDLETNLEEDARFVIPCGLCDIPTYLPFEKWIEFQIYGGGTVPFAYRVG